ncbi:DUF2520 domain-containing protein [Ferruginibacter lapsinanis]|uniref:Rossmann-like and DUF2520 domain-containing protein n=1 Tax=Ferruginibacter lapsinanis TaxID=563172 RepID=UPI001E42A242|nr:Rossmann-like and DUF2520 domain-containing protein [Ferruginibacter lapsinanis]UEG49305.1 DUF2520 domain-containing protein [Ferruginibacter lapsinanis]
MRIVMIGSGNVATVLGKIIKKAGHEILQVVSRNEHAAESLAEILGCGHCGYKGLIDETADIYLFAISDTALYEVGTNFDFGKKIALHTAGSVSKNVLEHVSANFGVLYPLQSLRKEMTSIPVIPLLVDGNNKETKKTIEEFAHTLSPIVSPTTDEERVNLHLAAVVVSNFSNHLYALTEDFCQKERVDFHMLHPIIAETALRIEKKSAAELQTGPALRNDFVTLEKHLKMLQRYPALKNIYLKMTDSIMSSK